MHRPFQPGPGRPLRLAVLALVVPLIQACSGTQTSRPATAADLQSGFSGYLYYPPIGYAQVTETTTIVLAGKIVARQNGVGAAACRPVQSTKYVASEDYAHPRIVSYRPGVLEAYKFGVEWTDQGTLKSVNIESTPDQGKTAANLSTAAVNIAKIAGAGVPTPAQLTEPPCADGETLIGSTKVEWAALAALAKPGDP